MQPGIGNDLLEIWRGAKDTYRDTQNRSRMAEIGGIAGRGDYNKAAALAFGSGDLGTGSSLLQLAQGQKKFDAEDRQQVAGALYAADTREKWDATINFLEKSGHKIDDNERDFANRDALIGQALGPDGQLKQRNDDRSFGLQEKNFNADEAYRNESLALEREKLAREGGKPPQVESFFDQGTGQQYKAQWNSQTQSWDKVGGSKADENGITITNPDGTTTQIGGSGGKVTEGMRRAKGFKASMKSSIESLDGNFDALTIPQNYLGDQAKNFGGRKMMTPEGQMAADNFDEVVGSMLYIASGATLTIPEIGRKKATIIPTPNDSKETIALKKKRLQDLKNAVDIMAGDQPQEQPTGGSGGWTVMPNGVKIRKKTQ
jgi:hypothetical protein